MNSGHPDLDKSLTHGSLTLCCCQQPVLPSPPPHWISLLTGESLKEVSPGQEAGGLELEPLKARSPPPPVPNTLARAGDPLCLPSAGTFSQSPLWSTQFSSCPRGWSFQVSLKFLSHPFLDYGLGQLSLIVNLTHTFL